MNKSTVEDKFEQGLHKRAANFTALTPLTLLERAAQIYPTKVAVIDGPSCFDYATLYRRCRCLASALSGRGIRIGETVAVMAPNVPALLEAHYGVAMCGAVLNAINTRLDADTVAFILRHGEARLLIADQQHSEVVSRALAKLTDPPPVIGVEDPGNPNPLAVGEKSYEAFLGEGDPAFWWVRPADEWQAISLNYTSGTTGSPKGVVYHHRGAFLCALGNSLQFKLRDSSVYLWTLPMFHCNGWTFPWAVCAVGGTHVCLRRVEPEPIFAAIGEHGVTHMCGAPVVLNMLAHAPATARRAFPQIVEVATGGAAPPSAVIARMEAMGFHVTHLYGLTETFGPATICAWQDSWDALDPNAQAAIVARQGVRYPTLDGLAVMDPESMQPVPADGETIGELMLRGNSVMKGYLKNSADTDKALADGWLHTGDLGVMHRDGYVEIKDRSKDIIISGGENVSSLEVEEVLYQHGDIMEAAVVARPDAFWGETPCAFVTLKSGEGSARMATDIIEFCRQRLAHFKAPKRVVFCELPKTSTGKIQKNVLRDRARALGQESPDPPRDPLLE